VFLNPGGKSFAGKPEDAQRWLLFRRSLSDPKELAYYVVSAPKPTPLV
jgi:hypothetical protein